MTSLSQTPNATTSAIEEIRAKGEIPSHIQKVWIIVSNIDNEVRYWSNFKGIKNINTTSINMTSEAPQRQFTIEVALFVETLTRQLVTVNPQQFAVQTNSAEGRRVGARTVALNPSSSGTNSTKVDIVWDVDLSSISLF